jgi:sulfate permease, SulP family
LTHGVRPPRARYRETIARAVADIKGHGADGPSTPDGLAAHAALALSQDEGAKDHA